MANPTRPMAQQQRRIIGRANLVEIPGEPEVDVIAIANDLFTGATFYIIAGVAESKPFGVWPSELTNLRWCMPLPAPLEPQA